MKKLSLLVVSGLFLFGLFIVLPQFSKVSAAVVTVTQPTSGSGYNQIPVAFQEFAPIVGNDVTYTFVQVPLGTTYTVVIDALSNPFSSTLNPHAIFSNANVQSASSATIPDDYYNLTVSWQRSSDNVVESTSISAVVIDTITLPITYNSPNNGVYSTSIPFDFAAPDSVLPGSLKATLNGPTTIVLTFIDNPAFTFSINPRNVLASPNIASSTSGAVIPQGTYSITMSYRDSLGNPTSTTPGATAITIVGDPTVTINAPTKSATGQITNTTINVTSLETISASSVTVAAGTTVGYSNFNCNQTTISEVNCTIKITSSGNLVVSAISSSSFSGSDTESGYIVTSASGTPVPPPTTPSPTPIANPTEIPTSVTINGTTVSAPVINEDGTPVTNAIVSKPNGTTANSIIILIICLISLLVLGFLAVFALSKNKTINDWIHNLVRPNGNK